MGVATKIYKGSFLLLLLAVSGYSMAKEAAPAPPQFVVTGD